MRERIEYDNDTGGSIVSWLRYEYEGLNLLRIDQLYDGNFSGTIDSTDYNNDYWRPMNVYLHGPGAIGQIIKSKWFSYTDDQTVTPCTTGEYYYFYDAVGNVVGVWDQRDGAYHSWAMDAFGNPLSGVEFLSMDQPGPKEHLTGKMFDTVTGLYYFAARWYDPEVGRFVSRDPLKNNVIDTSKSICSLGCGQIPINGNIAYSHLLKTDPSLLNTYRFANGNPIMYVDPNGQLEPITTVIIGAVLLLLYGIYELADWGISVCECLDAIEGWKTLLQRLEIAYQRYYERTGEIAGDPVTASMYIAGDPARGTTAEWQAVIDNCGAAVIDNLTFNPVRPIDVPSAR